jgi:hypothetical protein
MSQPDGLVEHRNKPVQGEPETGDADLQQQISFHDNSKQSFAPMNRNAKLLIHGIHDAQIADDEIQSSTAQSMIPRSLKVKGARIDRESHNSSCCTCSQ